MANLNRVFLMGNLTRDPELRYIPSGTAVATFTVASGRVYTLASGEKREETCFVRVVAWSRQAELCGEYLSKGSPVFVEGRLQSRSWETPEGQKRSTLEVVAQNIQFLSRMTKNVSSEEQVPHEAEASQATVSQGAGGGIPDPAANEGLGEVPF
jgi:single-strand DNA-binding protein